ncbi:MAG: response regulator [Planctomycetota bacterium]|nr:response regulator [Planctomycetota bacterium]
MQDILFVHDHQSSPGLRRTALERAGWRVRSTSSALECLAWLRQSKPALVLLDVFLEGSTGFDLCRRIRDHHPKDSLPIVLGCHIYQDPEHAEEALRAGAQRYLALPVEPEDLVATVAELTGEGQGVQAA